MNQQQRRAARAKAKNATVDPVVGIHEAGHALARYLTAEMMGVSIDLSVSSIVVHVPEEMPTGRSVDGKMSTKAQATTYGPMFSAEITAVSHAMEEEKGWADLPPTERGAKWSSLDNRQELMKRAREEGCDVEQWLLAKAIIRIAGAMVESLHRGVPWEDVWNGYEAEDDKRGLVGDAMALGLSDEELAKTVHDAENDAFTWFKDKIVGTPGALDALNALAPRINRPGVIPGRVVVGIIYRAIDAAR